MSLANEGKELVRRIKLHVLEVMQELAECQPAGEGIRKSTIEEMAGFNLGLRKPHAWHGYLCHGILLILEEEGKVENCGVSGRPLWRIKRSGE